MYLQIPISTWHNQGCSSQRQPERLIANKPIMSRWKSIYHKQPTNQTTAVKRKERKHKPAAFGKAVQIFPRSVVPTTAITYSAPIFATNLELTTTFAFSSLSHCRPNSAPRSSGSCRRRTTTGCRSSSKIPSTGTTRAWTTWSHRSWSGSGTRPSTARCWATSTRTQTTRAWTTGPSCRRCPGRACHWTSPPTCPSRRPSWSRRILLEL